VQCDEPDGRTEKTLGWRTPQEVATGETPDISILLHFMFWDIACCAHHASKQPGSQKGQEIRGRFVGFAWDVGHKLTFLVLADDTQNVIKRTVQRLANCPENEMRLDENNLRLNKAAGKGLRSKVNFTTAGRDPCLADGFIMMTPVPDEEKLNDASPPEGDDDSVDTEIGTPDSIEKVPDLPENCDEELLNHAIEEKPSEVLKGKQGRRKKKDAFQGNHRSDKSSIPVCKSPRPQRDANMWKAFDPTKSKLDQEIDRRVRSRSPKQKKEEVERPKLESEGCKTYKSAMANPLPRDQPTRKWTAQDQDNLADHLKHRKPGEENPLDKPLKFGKRALQTLNPTEDNLKPEEMIGRTFLMPPTADGSRHRAKIVESARDMKDKAHRDPAHIKFKCLVNNDFEEVVACNNLVDFIEKDTTWEGVWTFKKIVSHEKARKGNKDHHGAGTNCLVLWSTGEQTWEPLCDRSGKSGLWIDDPVMAAICARDNGLLDEPGWKFPGIKKIAKTQKKLIHMANKAKLHSFRSEPVHMCGFQVPRNHSEALAVKQVNGNTMWTDAETTELNQIDVCKSFIDKGVGHNPGSNCKRIRSHLVCAVKHDG